MGNFEFDKYCTPAQLYLILGTIGIISGFFKGFMIETLLTKALFLVIWAWVLNWLCSKGFKAISWILVLLPFILFFFTFFFLKDIVSNAAHAEGFCTAEDVSKIDSAFSTLKSSLQNKPQQSEIDNALMTFKTTLDGITTEAKDAAASMSDTGGGTSSINEGFGGKRRCPAPQERVCTWVKGETSGKRRQKCVCQ